jgi:putative serine protease PepD
MPPVDHPPHPQAYPPPVQQQKKSGGVTATLVAGIAVLALLAGGVAGGIGGYLVSNNETTTVSAAPNALDAPPPAKQTSTAPQGSVEYAAQKLLPSVVELSVQSPTSAGKGSGVVFSKDGMILTNNHVVQGAGQGGQIVAKFYDGQTAPATVVGTDPTSDLAVVKVSGVSGLTPADFGRSDDLRVGQQVIAAGSPFELSNTVTSGIVSSLHRPVRAGGEGGGQVTVLDAIQTDAPINPGNSGGPLVNTAGQVIGINSAIYSPSQSSGLPGADQQAGNVGVGFAIPVDQARRVGDQLAKTGAATQAMLQVTVTDARQGEGAQIVNVNRGGAAAKAGVQSGSVVVNADNRPIDSADGLIALVHSHKPGDRVTLKFEDGTSAQVTLAGEKVGG